MIGPFAGIAARGLFVFDPETAHGLSIAALKAGLVPACRLPADPRLALTVAGIRFPNPLGLAAGYDKNAEVPDAILKLGFGFAEIGTVTPKPQRGNDKPRIFRLIEDRGVINRLGFNNEGHEVAFRRLHARRALPGIVGVNIGANKDAADRVVDYVAGIVRFYGLASYFTVNISSPNTPGLRDLQARDSLKVLLEAVLAARAAQAARHGRIVPVFLKVAPDLTEEGLDDIAAEAASHPLDGLIVSNTTVARNGLKNQAGAREAGGLSGAPLFRRSTAVLAKLRKRVGPDLAVIGVGGVSGAADALEKIRAGADLVQLYSGMVYEGPGLAAAILGGLSSLIDRENMSSIRALRDTHVDRWAAEKL